MSESDSTRLAHRERIGIVGTGFIGSGLARFLARDGRFRLGPVLTRRPLAALGGFPCRDAATHSLDEFLDATDVVVECSGDPLHATVVVDAAFERGLPVVTMNAEFQVTTGSWLVGRGLLTEAEGDQPGSLAALAEEARAMGFRPLVYGNRKGFLDEDPSEASMRHWAREQGIRLDQVTAATDGTKVQIEQALVANGLGADIARPGLLGPQCSDLGEGARELAEVARRRGRPIADYLLHPGVTTAVFLAAEHDAEERAALQYFRLGPGPVYVLERGHHLCHLEIAKTVERVLRGGGALIHNSSRPRLGVAAVAKRALAAGERIERGLGSFQVRGRAVRIAEQPDHVPIGLLSGALLRRRVEPGETLGFDQLELPDSLALRAWFAIRERATAPAIRSGPAAGLAPTDRVA